MEKVGVEKNLKKQLNLIAIRKNVKTWILVGEPVNEWQGLKPERLPHLKVMIYQEDRLRYRQWEAGATISHVEVFQEFSTDFLQVSRVQLSRFASILPQPEDTMIFE